MRMASSRDARASRRPPVHSGPIRPDFATHGPPSHARISHACVNAAQGEQTRALAQNRGQPREMSSSKGPGTTASKARPARFRPLLFVPIGLCPLRLQPRPRSLHLPPLLRRRPRSSEAACSPPGAGSARGTLAPLFDPEPDPRGARLSARSLFWLPVGYGLDAPRRARCPITSARPAHPTPLAPAPGPPLVAFQYRASTIRSGRARR